MPKIYNKFFTKKDYYRLVGDDAQCFGIREFTCHEGKSDLTRGLNVTTATSLEYDILTSKGLDIFKLSFKGINISFASKAGLTSPWLTDGQGWAYRYGLSAGFMYTAGFSNVGGPQEDIDAYHYAHGSLKDTPAHNVSHSTVWNGDDCSLVIDADITDSAFYGRNLNLHRTITTPVGTPVIHVCDTIENRSFHDEDVMLLYHMNFGYPFLCKDLKIYIPITHAEPITDDTEKSGIAFDSISDPIDNGKECLYALKLKSVNDRSLYCLYNEKLRLGIYVRYNTRLMPYLIEWKSMVSGDYALGLLPSTCKPMGRKWAKENGEMLSIPPFKPLKNEFEIGFIDGDNELEPIKSEINSIIGS